MAQQMDTIVFRNGTTIPYCVAQQTDAIMVVDPTTILLLKTHLRPLRHNLCSLVNLLRGTTLGTTKMVVRSTLSCDKHSRRHNSGTINGYHVCIRLLCHRCACPGGSIHPAGLVLSEAKIFFCKLLLNRRKGNGPPTIIKYIRSVL